MLRREMVFGGILMAGLAASGSLANAQDAILQVNVGGESRSYTLDDLQAMQTVEFATTTIWTEGTIVFTGVPLSALIGDVPEGTVAQAVALNDYAVDIPVSALGSEYPVVAYFQNGSPFSARDKGPLWIVYPYDSDQMYRSDEVYAYSVWQLSTINVNQ